MGDFGVKKGGKGEGEISLYYIYIIQKNCCILFSMQIEKPICYLLSVADRMQNSPQAQCFQRMRHIRHW